MSLKEILNEREKAYRHIRIETETKMSEIIQREFSDFDKVLVYCPTGCYCELEFHIRDRWIKFYVSNVLWNGKCARKTKFGEGQFTDKEIKSILERIQKLF